MCMYVCIWAPCIPRHDSPLAPLMQQIEATDLHAAAQNGHTDTVLALLQAGVNVDAKGPVRAPCVCVCVCVWMCVCMCIVLVYIHIYVCMYTYTYVSLGIYKYIYMYIYTRYIHIHILCTFVCCCHTCMLVYVCMCRYAYMNIRMILCIHIQVGGIENMRFRGMSYLNLYSCVYWA